MKLHKFVPMIALGLLAPPIVLSQDQLTPAITSDLTNQCTADPGYQSCVSALRYHGLGKDDSAMEVLLSQATAAAKERYKVAQDMPNEGFWKLVATAGAVAPGGQSCIAALPTVLSYHFGLSPKALSDAADDSAKNKFLALSDLLARPNGAINWLNNDAQVYRLCFLDPGYLFKSVKDALGR